MNVAEIVRRLCPDAHPVYREAMTGAEKLFGQYGITNPHRMAHFLAQVFHETGGLTILVESGNYSAARIRQVWPTRPEAVQFAGNPRALFNSVYGGRMGNWRGTDDGFKYRGRGPLQTTGRDAYLRFGKRLGVDLISDPDALLRSDIVLLPALLEWQDGECNVLADRNDIRSITRRINGGLIGYEDRVSWFNRVWKLVGDGGASWASARPDATITDLQSDLLALGYPLKVDGKMGPETVAAVKTFQRDAGVTADGVPGPITFAAIKAALEHPERGKREATGNPPAVANAGTKGAGGVALGIAGDALLEQGQKLDALADLAPVLRWLSIGLIVVGAALLAYAVIRPLLKQDLSAPA